MEPKRTMTLPLELICCPRCKNALSRAGDGRLRCANTSCELSTRDFLQANGQPVLVDFDASVFDPSAYADGKGSVILRDEAKQGLWARILALIYGHNVTSGNCAEFLRLAKALSQRPRILVIGGGALGYGANELYNDAALEVFGSDVYASSFTSLVCDAHSLPFRSGAFDGVWIQAVLEHVLEPHLVVSEIHRVLRPDGVVYAETPFMQQVHEGAYDFTRFTLSGHRWLFRNFDETAAGQISGPGTVLLWSIRYLLRATGVPNKAATGVSLAFFPIRFLDGLARNRNGEDAASGIFFLGRRSAASLSPKDMVNYYQRRK